MDLNDFIPALRYGATIPTDANDITLSSGSIIVGDSSSTGQGVRMCGSARIDSTGSVTIRLASGKMLLGNSSGNSTEVTPSGAWTIASTGVATLGQGAPFIATASVGTIAIATGVTLLSDATVAAIGATAKVYLQGFVLTNGAFSWVSGIHAGTGTIQIEDSGGTTIFFDAGHTGGTIVFSPSEVYFPSSSGTIRTRDAYKYGTGGSAGAGIRVKTTPSGGTIASGGTFVITVWGIIK